MAIPPAAVAPYISPSEEVTSTYEVTLAQYTNWFEVEKTTNLNDLFSNQPTTRIGNRPKAWVKKLKRAINDSASESSMNASIQCLINRYIPGKENYSATDHSVTEKTLSTIFGFRHWNGLPIRMDSRPNFCWGNKKRRFILGKGENHEAKSIEHASRQNASYLLVNLHYQVVHRSRLPHAVYGIAVAGSRCSVEDYNVVLQRLSLPRTLGGKLQLRELKLGTSDTDLESVWEFLSRATKAAEATHFFLKIDMSCPAPSAVQGTEEWVAP